MTALFVISTTILRIYYDETMWLDFIIILISNCIIYSFIMYWPRVLFEKDEGNIIMIKLYKNIIILR